MMTKLEYAFERGYCSEHEEEPEEMDTQEIYENDFNYRDFI